MVMVRCSDWFGNANQAPDYGNISLVSYGNAAEQSFNISYSHTRLVMIGKTLVSFHGD